MTDTRHDDTSDDTSDDAPLAELRALDAPPPLPADSIWRGVEGGLADALERERAQRAARRRVHFPLAGAIAASLALFATGAVVGYGLSGDASDGTAPVVVEQESETSTPAENVAGDTVQVAWF